MKRSQIARKTPLVARKPISRGKPMQKGRRKVQKAAQKDGRWRSPEYIAWVKSLPCCFCGLGPSDPHHVIGLGWGLSGMGLTAPDSYVMPLCRTHHSLAHESPGLQRHQPDWLRWTIAKGVRHFDGEIREELRQAWAFIEERGMVK